MKNYLSSAEGSILSTLAYFDIFNYPLKDEEINRFLPINLPANEFRSALQHLTENRIIFYYQGFYTIQENLLLAYRRKEGNAKAFHLLKKATKIGKFLYRFPFTRAIGISGSLSKNYADEKADIDFFIITKANRLWIARTCMHLYKKLMFLTGKQHYYCMNYYIDEKAFELTAQNIFTAIEIKTVIPVAGNIAWQQFFRVNRWADTFLPQSLFPQADNNEPKRQWLKTFPEWLLNNRLGDLIDQALLKISASRWRRKEEKGKKNTKGIRMGLQTSRHFAKSNPGGFQEKVLQRYQEKLDELLDKHLHQDTIFSSRS